MPIVSIRFSSRHRVYEISAAAENALLFLSEIGSGVGKREIRYLLMMVPGRKEGHQRRFPVLLCTFRRTGENHLF